MHPLSLSLSLVSLLALLVARDTTAIPAPQVTLTATIPGGGINPTLTITVSTPPITTTPTATPTTTQGGGGSAVTTSPPNTSPTPWIIVLPGYGNVTRQGDAQLTTTTTTTATTTTTTEIPLVGTDTATQPTQTTQTFIISVSDIPVVTATLTLPQLTSTSTPPPARARKLRRRQTPSPTTTVTATTTTTQPGGGQATATSGAGDSIFAYGQAFLFEPPTPEQAADPYFGPFAAFRTENLTVEEEQRLVNRSYYFKGTAYSGQAQVQLAANQSTPASDPAVFDIPSPSQQPPLVPKQLSWQSPDHPQVSRKSLAVSPQNGVLAVNTSWTGLPGGFISVQPVQGLLGSVLMPYQVAPVRRGQVPVPSPAVASVSYVVLAPQNTRKRQPQIQQGGQPQQPQPGQSGGVQGGFIPRQIEALRTQAVIDKHIAVISDIDDVVKETRVSNPRQGLLNTFTQEYAPIAGMPSLFQNTLAQTYANTSTAVTFSYVSGTPMPLAPSLLQFLDAFYPPGSLTLRPSTTFDPQSFINALADGIDNNFRRQAHIDILNTYATAQAVIFGDTAARTFQTYVRLLEQYPGRIACVYLRNLTAVDPGSSTDLLTALTREQAYEQVRQVLPVEMRGMVEQMVVPFVDPGELVGMNLTTTPARCV